MFRFIDLFAGIGGMRIPFESLGGKCVFSSEWEKYARRTYIHNFGDIPAGDITKIDGNYIPDHDILLAGFPCQPFSSSGKRRGFEDTRGTMFYEIVRILNLKRPQAFLLENVPGLIHNNGGKTFSVVIKSLITLGYKLFYRILNALDYNVVQRRKRIYIVGFTDHKIEFKFPKLEKQKVFLEDILEPDHAIDRCFFLSENDERYRNKLLKKGNHKTYKSGIWYLHGRGISIKPFFPTIKAHIWDRNHILIDGIRRPSIRELLRAQGFPENFNVIGSINQSRKQIGNSVAVPVVEAIAKQMLLALGAKQ